MNYFAENNLAAASILRTTPSTVQHLCGRFIFCCQLASTRPIVRLLHAWHGIYAGHRQGRTWQPCYSHEGCTRLCCFYKTQNPQNPLLSSLQENTELSGPPQPQRTYATKSGAQTPASYHSVLAESRPYGGSLPWRLWHFVLRIKLLVSCFLLENTLFTTRILLILSTRSRTHCTHHHEKIVLELRACAKSDPRRLAALLWTVLVLALIPDIKLVVTMA